MPCAFAFSSSPLLSPLPVRQTVPVLLRLRASVFQGKPLCPRTYTKPRILSVSASDDVSCNTVSAQASTPVVNVEKGAVKSLVTPGQSDVTVDSCQLTFQDAILRLQEYWAARGCVLWHPYNTEVGAGTMNPATFLRVLGPEPWSVAYEEPSIRPDDSRYGENPNRLQCHTQFQVIVKPAPECPQELVVGSYRALGIDVTKRDIRFVEDNWESPALGAWGLGWEVWLDGMEITQFTYFQQAGSLGLNPVSVEITYGLERIIMALQGKTHFKDIVYAPGITYGEIFAQNEVEMSRYNLDEADIARNRVWFDEYEAEALQLLRKRLPVPAFNFLLKASHTFNILDSRGAVGVTERTRFFQRMRTLSRKVAQLWVERREEIGHPLLGERSLESITSANSETPRTHYAKSTFEHQSAALVSSCKHADFVFEVGVEELPADDVTSAIEQFEVLLRAALEKYRLSYATIDVDGTPRRISATVKQLQVKQDDTSKRIRGPSIRAAIGQDRKLTKAALGFMRSQSVANENAIELDEAAGYIYATVNIPGRRTADVLAEALSEDVLAKIVFGKTMRWNESGVAFSRPIRWILCLLNDVTIPLEYAGVSSGYTTRALRGADGFANDVPVQSAEEYWSTLKRNQIVCARKERQSIIRSKAAELSAGIGGKIRVETAERDLLNELTDLVENPIPLLGRFDPTFLSLPTEVLVTVMKKHQRYFPVFDENGNILNAFIAVANGNSDLIDLDAVRAGNEAVLRARYSDAAFFYSKDTKDKRLSDFIPVLDGLMFQEKLGSMLDKVRRVESATPAICNLMGLTSTEAGEAQDVARLYKTDLGTSMVIEMTSLAGVMGRHYASQSGEVPKSTADAIFDAVLPRFSGDQLPQSRIGSAVGIADRIESLASLFGVGIIPKATADPFGLRRAALGLIQILITGKYSIDIRDAVAAFSTDPEVSRQVCEFVGKRLEGYLDESGFRPDVVKAILAVSANSANPCSAQESASSLQAMLESPSDKGIVYDAHEAYGRARRLIKSVAGGKENAGLQEISESVLGVDENIFEANVEHQLLAGIRKAEGIVGGDPSVSSRIRALCDIKKDIDEFCDGVFVAVDDIKVRNNRVALLHRVAQLTLPILDLSCLQLE